VPFSNRAPARTSATGGVRWPNLMNLALWIAAGLLAVVALAGGISKALVLKAPQDGHSCSSRPMRAVSRSLSGRSDMVLRPPKSPAGVGSRTTGPNTRTRARTAAGGRESPHPTSSRFWRLASPL